MKYQLSDSFLSGVSQRLEIYYFHNFPDIMAEISQRNIFIWSS